MIMSIFSLVFPLGIFALVFGIMIFNLLMANKRNYNLSKMLEKSNKQFFEIKKLLDESFDRENQLRTVSNKSHTMLEEQLSYNKIFQDEIVRSNKRICALIVEIEHLENQVKS